MAQNQTETFLECINRIKFYKVKEVLQQILKAQSHQHLKQWKSGTVGGLATRYITLHVHFSHPV